MPLFSEREDSRWQHLSIEYVQEVIWVFTLIEVYAKAKLPGDKTTTQFGFASNKIILDFAVEVFHYTKLWIEMPETFLDANGELVDKNELRKELETIIEFCR